MSDLTLDSLKQALTNAGFEIYRIDGTDIRLAERVRMHLMESGVVLCCSGEEPRVTLTVRGQRSDFPSASEADIFKLVRETVGAAMNARNFEERAAATRNIHNPADDSHLLDVWFEVTFERTVADPETALEDIRWALSVPKCVDP